MTGQRFLTLSAVLFLAGAAAACGSSHGGAVAQPTITPHSGPPAVNADVELLRREGYTVDRSMDSPVGNGRVLHLFHAICTGSVDGSCQEVVVFFDHEKNPIWRHHYQGPSRVQPAPDGFTVKFEEYRATDPICCPSGPSILDTYRWNGRRFSKTSRSEPHS